MVLLRLFSRCIRVLALVLGLRLLVIIHFNEE